jgi:hypothetical protein
MSAFDPLRTLRNSALVALLRYELQSTLLLTTVVLGSCLSDELENEEWLNLKSRKSHPLAIGK